jgi:AraC family transcriptional regulator
VTLVAPCSEKALDLPTARLRIREYDFREPMTSLVMLDEDQNYLNICLTSRARDSYGSNAEAVARTEHEVGRIFFVPARTPLRFRWGPGRPRELQCMYYGGDFEQLASSCSRERLRDTLHVTSPSLHAAASRIVAEMTAPGFASSIVIESLCSLMAVDLVRNLSTARTPGTMSGGLPGWRLRRIEERLHVDGSPPTLSELASLCGLSPRHLRRAFRQQTGRGLGDLVTEVRRSRAEELLASDNMSLKEIAYRLGFAHPSAFSTAFRRATGESPSDYRARLRG